MKSQAVPGKVPGKKPAPGCSSDVKRSALNRSGEDVGETLGRVKKLWDRQELMVRRVEDLRKNVSKRAKLYHHRAQEVDRSEGDQQYNKTLCELLGIYKNIYQDSCRAVKLTRVASKPLMEMLHGLIKDRTKQLQKTLLEIEQPGAVNIWENSAKWLEPKRLVAAHVPDGEESLWILARILEKIGATRFDVVDIEKEEKIYRLQIEDLIPVPTRDDVPLNTRRLFLIGQRVLAIYPNTSVFYNAHVFRQPITEQGKYDLIFEQDDNKITAVAQEFILPFYTPDLYSSPEHEEQLEKER